MKMSIPKFYRTLSRQHFEAAALDLVKSSLTKIQVGRFYSSFGSSNEGWIYFLRRKSTKSYVGICESCSVDSQGIETIVFTECIRLPKATRCMASANHGLRRCRKTTFKKYCSVHSYKDVPSYIA